MKKVLFAIATVACVFAMTSCDKKCTCKTWLNGNVIAEAEYTIDKNSDKHCSDYATQAVIEDGNGNKTGVECK